MASIKQFSLTLAIVPLLLAGCSGGSFLVQSKPQKPDILIIHENGTMEFRERIVPEEDVVIYADGFGGEKAAVKLHVPLHPSFYRDSIIVERRLPPDALVSDAD